MNRDVVVTGIGLVSSLGEGVGPHLEAVRGERPPVIDRASFAPYPVHPLAPVNFDLQIPKKSDQRQMEPWQRIGVYAAGLALDDAGIKSDAAAKDRLHVIVAAGGGERDHAVDGQILTGLKSAEKPGVYLNERLMSDLRPTLFLAQLSNLLAGNISIVHGVTGPSRTFMGEEQAGVDALRIAQARIAAGQADMVLVGGSYNAERRDMLLLFELGGFTAKGEPRPVMSRIAGSDGMVTGSVGAFLVLEAADTASARGAAAKARLLPVQAERTRRQPGDVQRVIAAQVEALGEALGDEIGAPTVVLSAAPGVAADTAQESAALAAAAADARVMALGDLIGHGVEAAFPAAVAIAAGMIGAGLAPDALVTCVGHRRGEGAARLCKV
jgi:3-oxoacyl-[acyl-carrier-protein] synthase II